MKVFSGVGLNNVQAGGGRRQEGDAGHGHVKPYQN